MSCNLFNFVKKKFPFLINLNKSSKEKKIVFKGTRTMKIKLSLFIALLCSASHSKAKLLKIYNNTGETIKVRRKYTPSEITKLKKKAGKKITRRDIAKNSINDNQAVTELKHGETKFVRIHSSEPLSILFCGDKEAEGKIKPLESAIEIQQAQVYVGPICKTIRNRKFKIRPFWGKKRGEWRNLPLGWTGGAL